MCSIYKVPALSNCLKLHSWSSLHFTMVSLRPKPIMNQYTHWVFNMPKLSGCMQGDVEGSKEDHVPLGLAGKKGRGGFRATMFVYGMQEN